MDTIFFPEYNFDRAKLTPWVIDGWVLTIHFSFFDKKLQIKPDSCHKYKECLLCLR